MPRFKLESPVVEGITTLLRTKPVIEVEKLLATIASKAESEVKMFEQEELVPILNYLVNCSYNESHSVLNRIFSYKEDGSFSITPEPEEVPVIQPEVVASPPETSLEASPDVQ